VEEDEYDSRDLLDLNPPASEGHPKRDEEECLQRLRSIFTKY